VILNKTFTEVNQRYRCSWRL